MTQKKDNTKIGETQIMHCGLKATIISYRTSTDIDIQFEDGTIRQHVGMPRFRQKCLTHPCKNILFNKYKLNKIAFQYNNKSYFYVIYTEGFSEFTDIMCIDDMKKQINKNTVL